MACTEEQPKDLNGSDEPAREERESESYHASRSFIKEANYSDMIAWDSSEGSQTE